MIILERPNFPPYVCISCGLGNNRGWFVSLNLPLDTYFNPVNEGNVFFCNECWENLVVDVSKAVHIFAQNHEPWYGGEYIKPQYENKKELVEEVSFGGTSTSPTIHSPTTVGSEPEPESDDSEPESPVTDDEGEPVSEFRVFFGDGTGES